MKRFTLNKLLNWKQASDRKPLMFLGARQVGKTWLVKEFARLYYQRCIYINFDKDRQMAGVFEKDFDMKRIIMSLEILGGGRIVPEETLIFLDEIQECPSAVTSLKYWCEDAREYHVIAAGSLLGVADLLGTGFPVGKVDRLYLNPMTFGEFLVATDNGMLLQLIESRDWKMMEVFNDKITDLLRYYYFVGGMPAVVASFASERDFGKVRRIQQALLADFHDDFGKHVPKDIKGKIEMIWDVIPAQLAKENKKFKFVDVGKGESSTTLESAFSWLKGSGLISLAHKVTKPSIPLSSYKDDAFKVYFLDVGLLAAASNLKAKVILEGNRIFQEFKGALTEQYVQQQLLAEHGVKPYYWTSSSGQAEVDFIVENDEGIFPLEAKASRNLQAKSLKLFCQKFQPAFAVRASMSHYYKQEIPFEEVTSTNTKYTLFDIPLYAISQIMNELKCF